MSSSNDGADDRAGDARDGARGGDTDQVTLVRPRPPRPARARKAGADHDVRPTRAATTSRPARRVVVVDPNVEDRAPVEQAADPASDEPATIGFADPDTDPDTDTDTDPDPDPDPGAGQEEPLREDRPEPVGQAFRSVRLSPRRMPPTGLGFDDLVVDNALLAPLAPKKPLLVRVLRLQHLAPTGWQRAAVGDLPIVVAILLVLGDLATAWTVLVLPVVVLSLVKFHDLIESRLAPVPSPARVKRPYGEAGTAG